MFGRHLGRPAVEAGSAESGGWISPAGEWLLDVLYRPKVADTYQTFEIVHPDVLALFNLALLIRLTRAGVREITFLGQNVNVDGGVVVGNNVIRSNAAGRAGAMASSIIRYTWAMVAASVPT